MPLAQVRCSKQKSFQGHLGAFHSALILESSGASRGQKVMRLTLRSRVHSPEDPAGPAMPLQAYTVQAALIFSTWEKRSSDHGLPLRDTAFGNAGRSKKESATLFNIKTERRKRNPCVAEVGTTVSKKKKKMPCPFKKRFVYTLSEMSLSFWNLLFCFVLTGFPTWKCTSTEHGGVNRLRRIQQCSALRRISNSLKMVCKSSSTGGIISVVVG